MLPQILGEDAPILMFWIVKDPSKLQDNQLPLPNNQRYPYKQRLLNWAIKEPQRKIKLYYISIGLNTQQIKMLHDLSNPDRGGQSNIEIIDFIKKFAHKYDIQYLYNKNIFFTWKIDISRLIMLTEEGPAIYFDFDILPTDKKIGEITVNNNIGFAMGKYNLNDYYKDEWFDISVLVSTIKDNPFTRTAYHAANYICNQVIHQISDYKKFIEINMAPELVWITCLSIPIFTCNELKNCNQIITTLQKSNESLCNKIINILSTKNNRKSILSVYKDNDSIITQKFCAYGNFIITRDFTWISELNNKNIYTNDNNKTTIKVSNTEQEHHRQISNEPIDKFTTPPLLLAS
ncbi:hypothetical protein [Candidatus Neoehrlichia procyonis]|uniref:Uncharacterized protein n=1 Tax=Candidatus Neoehrlichia procyonis str. RAC413 TaxID=1359163 RepID=A0A0F3NLJ5_9RICK|nr:hypothetical protein [Candidatus Neoehrlichia lotoris]KJV68943.1 hypothetical protein NLO413_0315 [Candidatus Neoehrlichia lotoris str. RAC413]